MTTTPLAAAAAALLTLALPAQHRLLQAEDLPGREAACAAFEQVLEHERDLWTTIALAATGGATLAPGSKARGDLEAALARAHATADRDRALARLRLDLGDLVDVLGFELVREAELPAGFPDVVAVGEIELRRYPSYRMARTRMGPGGGNGAFWPLFQHIKKNDIAMTAPVQTDYGDARKRPATMAFLYGDRRTEPDEVSGGVEVVDVPAMTVLSIGATGYERRDRIDELEQRLRAFVARSGAAWEVAGPIRTMTYNGPSLRSDRRYFEVQLPVQRPALVR